MLGLERVTELDGLQHDALLAAKLRLEKLPHRATVYGYRGRFQRPADVEEVRAVHREIPTAANRQAKRQLPAGRPVRFVRIDERFGSDTFFRELEAEAEQRPLGSTIKHRLSSDLQIQFGRKLPLRRLPSTETNIIEATSLLYQPPTWAKARRVVLTRQRSCLKPAQLGLFEAFAWECQAIVTNLGWDEEDLWHFYNQRCTCGNGIKEL